MKLIKRKRNRLEHYDYSSEGYYFITICTAEKRKILCVLSDNGEDMPFVHLSNIGEIVHDNIEKLGCVYEYITVEKYVIMPNHIHMILKIDTDQSGHSRIPPTISHIINQFKGAVTKQIGTSIWQKSYYDHIIRNEDDFLHVCEYIENNPRRWLMDRYYVC